MERLNVKLILTINIVIVSTLVGQVLLVSHPTQTAQEEFCYKPEDPACNPNSWSGVCASGTLESPIDIDYKRLGLFWYTGHFKFNPQYFKSHSSFFARNNGLTFRVQLSSDADPKSDLTVSGGGLDGEYIFAQLHFHWGQRDNEGSEHTLMGRRYPMELHIVHFKSKYGSFANAIDQDDHEAIAVFGVLFELGAHNPEMESIIEAATSPVSIDPENGYVEYRNNLNFKKLLPKKMDFVRYLGSLTTPPCTQSVTWTVFLNPVSISVNQINALRQLHDAENETYFNFRPVQPLNGRELKFYKHIGGSIAPIIDTLFSRFVNFFSLIWKAISNVFPLITFNTGKSLLYWDDSVSKAVWSQNWFDKAFLEPMFAILNR